MKPFCVHTVILTPRGAGCRGAHGAQRLSVSVTRLHDFFYGYGLGLFGGLALSFAIYSVQVLLSLWWLRHFRFGPMEWIWRSLTYGRLQPMRMRIAIREALGPASAYTRLSQDVFALQEFRMRKPTTRKARANVSVQFRRHTGSRYRSSLEAYAGNQQHPARGREFEVAPLNFSGSGAHSAESSLPNHCLNEVTASALG
jgi:hypothetical protein